jgi:hypothetical protein
MMFQIKAENIAETEQLNAKLGAIFSRVIRGRAEGQVEPAASVGA